MSIIDSASNSPERPMQIMAGVDVTDLHDGTSLAAAFIEHYRDEGL